MTEALAAFKYVIFFLVMGIGVPLGYAYSKKDERVERGIFFMMIFFTARMEDINFVSRETERLTSKGFEIGMVDICTMIIYLLVLDRVPKGNRLPKGSQWFFAYFGFSVLSIINADFPLFSFFEVWKLLRMYFFYWTVYNYLHKEEQFFDFIKGVGAITIYVFYEVFKQKYLDGKFQTAGPFPHQNSLVMYMLIFGSITFSYLVNKEDMPFDKLVVWFAIFGMAAVSILSTLSRAGLALFGFAIVIVLGMSFLMGFTPKKMGVTFLLLLMSAGVLYKAWDSISERFRTAPEESAQVRVVLAQAAVKMANDKSLNYLGVGLNNFGKAINPPYPYSSHIEMHDAESEDEKNGLVETIYLMIAAESGWHTLVIFLIFLFYYFFLNLKNVFRLRGSPIQFIAIGLTGGLLAIYIESSLEWVLKQTNNFYEVMMIFAIIAAMDKVYNNSLKDKVKEK